MSLSSSSRLAAAPVRLVLVAVALVLSLAATILLTSPASAHVEMQGAEPPADSVVDAAPTEVLVLFTGEVGDTSTLSVTGPDGQPADNGDGGLDLDSLDRNLLRATLQAGLPDGVYTVSYSAVPIDGHEPNVGTYTFTVGAAGTVAGPTPELAVGTPVATPGATPVVTPAATPIALAADAAPGSNEGNRSLMLAIALAGVVALGAAAVAVTRTVARR